VPCAAPALKGDRHGQVAQCAVRRHLNRERRNVGNAEMPPSGGRDLLLDFLMDVQNHECSGVVE
jgi:hypothetical protein